MTHHPTRFLALLLVLLTGAVRLSAQSYIYIQGDKKTPFYVKMEGEMQPRYGKNYCILPELVQGPVHLEILFQQNVFPPQKFTVLVPENGYRGFLIAQREGAFTLFDLQQNFYLPAGNTEEEDHMPAPAAVTVAVNTRPAVRETPAPAVREKPAPVKKTSDPRPARQKPVVTTTRPAKKPAERQPQTKKQGSEGPQFLNGIELNRPGEPATATIDKPATTTATATGSQPVLSAGFRNSDCPEPMDDAGFEKVYKGMMEKEGDEDRLAYLYKQMDGCYKTWQARTLGSLLSADATRFTFLKKVYPRISDQAEFPLLDDLLSAEVWKAEFQKLIHP